GFVKWFSGSDIGAAACVEVQRGDERTAAKWICFRSVVAASRAATTSPRGECSLTYQPGLSAPPMTEPGWALHVAPGPPQSGKARRRRYPRTLRTARSALSGPSFVLEAVTPSPPRPVDFVLVSNQAIRRIAPVFASNMTENCP